MNEKLTDMARPSHALALTARMERQLLWSEGLPLKAAGFVGPRYKKDD